MFGNSAKIDQILEQINLLHDDIHEIRVSLTTIERTLKEDMYATLKLRKEFKESLALMGALNAARHNTDQSRKQD